MKIGNIPTKLKVFARAEEKLGFRWDDIDDPASRTVNGKAIFVADAENKNTQATGKSWASQRHWDYATKKHVESLCEELEWVNEPMSNVQIITLEHRGNGGRAYKVRIDNKYVYDLREDILLDTMIHEGIRPDAVLNGLFIFATVGSQMKLIRVGSLLHKKLLEYGKHKKAEPIKDFEVGGVYASSTKEALYIGKFANPSGVYKYIEKYERGWCGGCSRDLKRDPSQKTFHVFIDLWKDYDPNDLSKTLDRGHLNVLKDKPKSYKEKIFQYTESPEEIRRIHTKRIKNGIGSYMSQYASSSLEYALQFANEFTLLELPEYGEAEWVKETIAKATK